MFGDIQSDNEDDFVMPVFTGVDQPFNDSPDAENVDEDKPETPMQVMIGFEPILANVPI